MADSSNGSDEPVVREEQVDDRPPVTTTTSNGPLELLSDDGDDNAAARADPTDLRERVTTAIDVDEAREIVPSPEVLHQRLQEQALAQQQKLAEKFRNRAPQPAPAPTATPVTQSDDDDVGARYEAAKKEYYRKKRSNALDIQDEIAFMRIEGEYSAYKRKVAADAEYDKSDDEDDESGLFVKDTDRIPAPSLQVSDAEDAGSRKKRNRKRGASNDGDQPARKKAKKSKAADYSESALDEVLAAARTKKKVAAPKKKAQSRKKHLLPVNLTNTRSLYGADVFRDTNATANLDSQPTFAKQGRKDTAFKELVASVPLESREIVNDDIKFFDQAMKKMTGRGSVSAADGGNWTVKGMRTALKPYQLLGTSFMRERETGTHAPLGGILADEMGLGKTIMMLANIINGKPTTEPKSRDSSCRTTLIVATPALIAQWDQEIRAHCFSKREHKHGIGRILHHRAGSRINGNEIEATLKEADVVFTTYNEVSKSNPRMIFPPNLVTQAQKAAYWDDVWEKDRGVLHRVKWHRVVLDEASAIKNHKSHTSISCVALEANHHWAISGTPVQNSLAEFYPYFKFLREPAAGSHKIFKENFMTADDEVGAQRLHAILRKFMIRRTHLDKLFNARLLDLPKPHQSTLTLEFNDVERQIYEIVRKRFIERVNCMSKDGQLHKKFSSIWTMVLRLRQMTASVLLILDPCFPLLEREDFEKLNSITAHEDEAAGEGVQLLLHLRNVIKEGKNSESIEGGISASVLTENNAVNTGVIGFGPSQTGETGGRHGNSYRIRKYLDKFRETDTWEEAKERSQCVGCRSQPEDPYVTSCSHIYCYTCLVDLQHLAAARGYDAAKCSECGETYTSSRPCEEGFEAMQPRPTSGSPTYDLGSTTGSKSKKKESEIDWLGLKGEILPSAKTIAVKAQVLQWVSENPEVKIIIYTQWMPMVKILRRVCETEKWLYCTYHGGMTHEARAAALEDFSTNPAKRILIGSLKSGGMGLNITAASRVILLDPWWNTAIEQQAFCRVFRIGQKLETRMTRLVVRNSIDEAMMAIKERKKIEIDQVMSSAKLHERLSVEDLMRLFGNEVGEDEEGRPFIYADGDGNQRPRVAEDETAGDEGYMGDEP